MNQDKKIIPIQWLLALTLISVIASSLAQRYLGHFLESPNLDFYDYYFAAEIVRENPRAPLYEGAEVGNPQLKSAPAGTALAKLATHAGLGDTELYLYPPLLADLLRPLTRVSPQNAAVAWRLINLALVFVSVASLSRVLGLKLLSFEFLTVAFTAYAFWPTHEAISLGQVSIVLLALWAVGIAAYDQRKPGLSAIAFALATALKVTPICVLPLFVIWKDRRWIVSYVGALVALIAAMGAVNGGSNLTAYAHVMHSMSGLVPAVGNKCIGSLLAWLYYGQPFTLRSVHSILSNSREELALASKLVSLCFYAYCVFLAWLRQSCSYGRERDNSIVLAIFALVTCLISPVSWRHAYVVAIIPMAMLWVRALTVGATQIRMVLLTLNTITMGSLVFDLATQLSLRPSLKVALASTWIVFTILLSIETLRNRIGPHPHPRHPAPCNMPGKRMWFGRLTRPSD